MAHTNVPARWLLGGAGALALGSFLPWAEVGPFSVSGTDGDGVLTLGLGVLIAVVAWPSMQKAIGRGRSITASIAAGLALVVCVYDVLNVSSSDNDFIEAEVGIGLWVCTAGAIAVIVGLVLGAKRGVVRFGASPPGPAVPEPAVAAPTIVAPSAVAGNARWAPDPSGRHELRYWDGSAWSAHVSDAGVVGSDPFGGPQ